jgi:hypothetical protein
MPRFCSFTAYIEVDGVPVHEYDTKVERDAEGVPRVVGWPRRVARSVTRSSASMSTVMLTRGRQTFRVHCVDYRCSRSMDEYVYTLDGVLADGAITHGDYGPPLTTLAAIPLRTVNASSCSRILGRQARPHSLFRAAR